MRISSLIAPGSARRRAPVVRWGSWAVMAWLVGWVSLGAIPTAFAAQAATVMPIKLVGPVDPAAQSLFAAAVTKGLREQRILDVAASERDAILSSEPKLSGCFTELCMERIGRLLDSQLVFRAQATFTAGPAASEPTDRPAKGHTTADGNWELRLDVFDVEVGAIGASTYSDCHDCSATRAAQSLGDLVGRAVLESAARPRGYLVVSSVPPNAVVFVDGTELGFTPYKRLAFVGKHNIVVRSTGFRSYQGEVQIDESQKQQVSVTLQSGEDPREVVVVEKKATPVYKKWWFWVAIGGAALVAGGITAGAILGTREVVPNGMPGPVNIHF